MPNYIYLSPEEIATCRRDGRGRARRNRQHGNRDRKVSPQSGYDVDFYGRVGELAFAKWANIPDAIGVLDRPDSGYDFVWDGSTVDVKCSRHIPCNLLIPLKGKQPTADVIVQFGAEAETDGHWAVAPMGWTTREFWMDHHTIVDLGHGRTRFLPRNRLMPMKDLHDG